MSFQSSRHNMNWNNHLSNWKSTKKNNYCCKQPYIPIYMFLCINYCMCPCKHRYILCNLDLHHAEVPLLCTS